MDFLGGGIHEGNLLLDSGVFLGYAQPLDAPFFYSYDTIFKTIQNILGSNILRYV